MKEQDIYQNNKKALKLITSTLKYKIYMKKNVNAHPAKKAKELNKIKEAIKDFRAHRQQLLLKE